MGFERHFPAVAVVVEQLVVRRDFLLRINHQTGQLIDLKMTLQGVTIIPIRLFGGLDLRGVSSFLSDFDCKSQVTFSRSQNSGPKYKIFVPHLKIQSFKIEIIRDGKFVCSLMLSVGFSGHIYGAH